MLVDSQLDLVQETQGSTALLVHDLMHELGVEGDPELTKAGLNHVKVVHLGLFSVPIQFENSVVRLDEWVGYLPFRERRERRAETVLGEDLAEQIAVGEVRLEAVNVARKLERSLVVRRDRAADPIEHLFSCHINLEQ